MQSEATTRCIVEKIKFDETKQVLATTMDIDASVQRMIDKRNRGGQPQDAQPQDAAALVPLENLKAVKNSCFDRFSRGKDLVSKFFWSTCGNKLEKAKAKAKMIANTKEQQHTLHGQAPHVMVQRRSLRSTDGQSDTYIPLATPPLQLAAADAHCILEGLDLRTVIPTEELAKRSSVVVKLFEIDSAQANKAVIATTARHLPPNVMLLAVYCFLHQLHIICSLALHAVAPGSLTLVNSLYSCSLLLRQGYFEKVLEAIPFVVAEFVVIRPGATR